MFVATCNCRMAVYQTLSLKLYLWDVGVTDGSPGNLLTPSPLNIIIPTDTGQLNPFSSKQNDTKVFKNSICRAQSAQTNCYAMKCSCHHIWKQIILTSLKKLETEHFFKPPRHGGSRGGVKRSSTQNQIEAHVFFTAATKVFKNSICRAQSARADCYFDQLKKTRELFIFLKPPARRVTRRE